VDPGVRLILEIIVVDNAEVIMGLGIAGIKLEGHLVLLDRLLEFFILSENDTQIVMIAVRFCYKPVFGLLQLRF
jgi:hypothetical protein